MQIAKNTIVTIHYEMFDADNNLLDKTEEPISYLHGGYDGIFPLVEEALEGKNVGESVDVKLTSDDAFGDPEEELIRVEDLEVFPATSKSAWYSKPTIRKPANCCCSASPTSPMAKPWSTPTTRWPARASASPPR